MFQPSSGSSEYSEISGENSKTESDKITGPKSAAHQNQNPKGKSKDVENSNVDKSTAGAGKKKRKRRCVTICLTNCRYDVIKKVSQKFGLREVAETDNWNLYWTDLSISIERCKEMKRFQRINHFPGMLEICRKDLLARNLNRMAKLYPKDYNFFPKTWCLPADLGDALNYSRLRKNKTFILKPDAGSQGRGIYITKTLKDIKPTEKMICQVYISRPFLIDGYKFDLRVYTLLTSCDPLRIYVYNEGLVRFATSRYHEPTGVNSTNVFMHLTNYAVNKHSRTYNADDESGSKRKLTWFNTYMRALGHDVHKLWQKIDDVIIKTIFSALPILKHSYHACFPNHDLVPACCELLGMDIMIDRHLCPQLLEVNHSPSFHTDTVLDYEVKESLLTDMFSMLNLEHCDKKKIMREDRKRVQDRLTKGSHIKEENQNVNNMKRFLEYHRHEMNNRGGYRLIYPDSKTEHMYVKFLRQGQGSLYCDTASSNARQQAAAALRDEMQNKAKDEASKRVQSKPLKELPKIMAGKMNQNMSGKGSVGLVQNALSSFEPQMIVESEEKERLMMLAHRDFLVKSYGLVDHVYLLLKKNGALRPIDEKKYNLLKNTANNITTADKKEAAHHEKTFLRPAIKNLIDFDIDLDNKYPSVRCETAPLHSRPQDDNSNLTGIRLQTSTHRTVSNHVKLTSSQDASNNNKKNIQVKTIA